MDQRAVDKNVQKNGQRRTASVAMSRSEARAWKARWALVDRVLDQEMRTTPIEVKLRKTAALMESGLALGWRTKSAADLREVRQRWRRLRNRLSG